VQRYQRKDQRFQILYKIVEDAQSLWIVGIGDINQRANLRCLKELVSVVCTIKPKMNTNFERNMIVIHADFKLLPPVFVLLWPVLVTFPRPLSAFDCHLSSDNSLYFIISLLLIMRLISAISVSLTHTTPNQLSAWLLHLLVAKGRLRTFFPNERIISIVGVVCISRRCASAVSKDPEIEL
jgi:hypothetical protein